MNSYFLCLLLLFPAWLYGQNPCTEYQRVMDEVNAGIKQADELDAGFLFNKLRTARILARDCDLLGTQAIEPAEVDEKLATLFLLLEQQRDEAKNARAAADRTSKALRIERNKLVLEKEISDSLSLAAQNAADRAEAVLDKIYFYEGEFGLATEEKYGKIKFVFINKDLETKINFVFEEAQPFDNTGFAKVKYGDNYYLIDTSGQRYLLAEGLNQLTPTTEALDLRGQSIIRFPDSLQYFQNLKILIAPSVSLSDITGFPHLDNLQWLYLYRNQLSD
ncbi:MAG: hypothetical protein AAFU03_04205, partial [Bacteroidota bacterium]